MKMGIGLLGAVVCLPLCAQCPEGWKQTNSSATDKRLCGFQLVGLQSGISELAVQAEETERANSKFCQIDCKITLTCKYEEYIPNWFPISSCPMGSLNSLSECPTMPNWLSATPGEKQSVTREARILRAGRCGATARKECNTKLLTDFKVSEENYKGFCHRLWAEWSARREYQVQGQTVIGEFQEISCCIPE